MTRQRAESLFVLDVQIGRTISRLSASGQLRNTVIMFTSDNGYYLGEHRKRQGKINLHEPSLRVPLIIAGPGVPAGRRYDPVATVDMAPTLASYAGVRMPGADGIALNRLIAKGDSGWDRAVVTEGMMPEGRYAERHRLGPSPLNTRGLRLGRWKLTRYSTGEVELYDLRTDPLELRNLSRVPRYAGVLAGMKTALPGLLRLPPVTSAASSCRRPGASRRARSDGSPSTSSGPRRSTSPSETLGVSAGGSARTWPEGRRSRPGRRPAGSRGCPPRWSSRGSRRRSS